MQLSHSSIEEPRYHNGCLAVVRLLVVHVAVLRALLACVPPALLGVCCLYLTGLITGSEVSATAISQALGEVSHDTLTRFLHGSWWTGRQLLVAAVRVVSWLGGEGWLIVDDVLIPKPYARVIAFCGWDFDHALRRNVCGLRLVFVVWCNGWLTVPLGFYVWQKDPTRNPRPKRKRAKPGRPRKRGPKVRRHTRRARTQRARRQALQQAVRRVRPRTATGTPYHTKNELARALVWRVIRAGVRARFLLCDNWYASRSNLRSFARWQLAWVTRLKNNTVVRFQGHTMTVAQVAATVAPANYHYYAQLGARARAFAVEWLGEPIKLTVVKHDSHPERDRTKYLATNELSLSTAEHVRWYRRRWPVEVFFRDAKQLLGLGRSQARQPHAVLTHIMVVCVAYVGLQLLKPLTPHPQLSVSQSKKALLPLRLCVTAQGAACLVRLTTTGQFEPVDVEALWEPIRTRLGGLELPKHFGVP
jgi:Transposase DDE domain/DDE superfamily endonuclease